MRRGSEVACGWLHRPPCLAVSLSLSLLAACAPRALVLPTGDGDPYPQYARSFARVTAGCRDIRSLTAELRLSGRAGSSRIRGRVLAGIASPDSVRLEGVAPFGAPGFILAATGGRGTLLLPRDDRVVLDESPEAMLEALVGLPLRPDALLALATGCVRATPRPIGGRLYPSGWVAIQLAGGSTAYLRDVDREPRLVAATLPDLVVEYRGLGSGLPAEIRVRSTMAATDGRAATDLTIRISQTETNRTLAPAVFEVRVPATALPITLEELRRAGPLGDPR